MNLNYKLNEIFETQDIILFDTCAFNPPNRPLIKENLLLNKRKQLMWEKITHINYLHQLGLRDNFYITDGVQNELLYGLDYSEYIEEYEQRTEFKKSISLPPSLIRKYNKRTHSLLNLLSNNSRIINIKENLSKEYEYSKSRYIKSFNICKLSEVDMNLLLTGLTQTFIGKSAGIVSNDLGMYKCWREIINRENLNQKDFYFYLYNEELLNKYFAENNPQFDDFEELAQVN